MGDDEISDDDLEKKLLQLQNENDRLRGENSRLRCILKDARWHIILTYEQGHDARKNRIINRINDALSGENPFGDWFNNPFMTNENI